MLLLFFHCGMYPFVEQLARGVKLSGQDEEEEDEDEDDGNADQLVSRSMLFQCPNASLGEILISAGASVHARNHFGGSVLFMAARHGVHDMVPLLIRAGANVHDALWYHEGESSDYLLTASQPLHAAVHSSQRASSEHVAEMVHALVEAGAKPLNKNCDNHSPLWLALFSGFSAAAVHMLKHIPPTLSYEQLKEGTPVEESCFGGHDRERFDLDDAEPFLPLLHVAAASGCWQVVERLLSAEGCDVNELAEPCEEDRGGHTALFYACKHSVEDMYYSQTDACQDPEQDVDYHKTVTLLLAAGIDVLKQGYNKETALHWLTRDSTDVSLSLAHAITAHAGSEVLCMKNAAQLTPLEKLRAVKGRKPKNNSAEVMLASAAAAAAASEGIASPTAV